MDYLADLPMEANQYEATLEWLDKRGYFFPTAVAKYLARSMYMDGKGLSQAKIGRIVKRDQGTISRWLLDA